VRFPCPFPFAFPFRFTPPRLEEGEELDRHATWLELFFDLVFVVAVAELVHDLSGEVTALRCSPSSACSSRCA